MSLLDRLTKTERRTLTLVCSGLMHKEVAREIDRTTSTVNNQSRSILAKFPGKTTAGICFEVGREIGQHEGAR